MSDLRFEPSQVNGGEYRLAVGTAGSATLVLQAVLPALPGAREPSRVTLEGGTHNPFAPPFGSFRTLPPTAHTLTNAGVIQRFLSVSIAIEQESGDVYRVDVASR